MASARQPRPSRTKRSRQNIGQDNNNYSEQVQFLSWHPQTKTNEKKWFNRWLTCCKMQRSWLATSSITCVDVLRVYYASHSNQIATTTRFEQTATPIVRMWLWKAWRWPRRCWTIVLLWWRGRNGRCHSLERLSPRHRTAHCWCMRMGSSRDGSWVMSWVDLEFQTFARETSYTKNFSITAYVAITFRNSWQFKLNILLLASNQCS